MNIKEKSAFGVKWAFGTRVGRQLIQMVSYAVYARLLDPADFGVISMALLVNAFADIIKEFGFSYGLIQKKDLSETLASTVFWLNCVIGITLALCIASASSLIGYFFSEPRVIDVLQVLSIVFVISSLSSVQRALLEKRLLFKEVYLSEFIAQCAGSGIGLAMAFLGYGIWSLVIQSIAFAVIATIFLWSFSAWRPLFVFNIIQLKGVLRFSFNVTGFNIINFFARNADQILIGKFLGTTELGYYMLAYRVMLYPLQYISDVINRVMFPIYAKIQDDVKRFRNAYLKIASAIATITYPLMFGLMVVNFEFVSVFLGTKWTPVTFLLLILAPIGALQSVLTTVGSVYLSRGKSDIFFRWGLFSSAVAVASFIIGLHWGILGVAVCYAIASIVLSIPGFKIPLSYIDITLKQLAGALFIPLRLALFTAFSAFIIQQVLRLFQLPAGIVLAGCVLSATITYVIILIKFQKEFLTEMKGLFIGAQ